MHTSGILNTAFDVFSDGKDNKMTIQRLQFLFKAIEGMCKQHPLIDQVSLNKCYIS